MHQLIASPFLDKKVLVRPGQQNGVQLGDARFQALMSAGPDSEVPAWLSEAAMGAWGLKVSGRLGGTVLLRPPTELGYARATWEINKFCDYNCEHCYLGLKRFEGLRWADKVRLLELMRDSGALWLQITGGEPLIDKEFPAAYEYANELGMMVALASNGSQLRKPQMIELLAKIPPYRIVVSIYGATAESYDGMTRNRGAYDRFRQGLDAAHEAGLPVKLNVVISERNVHETDAMVAIADHYGFPYQTYTSMSPTIEGGGERLGSQAKKWIGQRSRFQGCNAGHTFFHADPFGKASICKVGRDPQFDLIKDGLDALRQLDAVADSLQLRTGGCSGCALSGTCYVCRPLAKLYQEAKAPLSLYCQHGEER